MDAYERRLIEEALRATGGNQRRAAQALGVLPTTLHEKMKRLGLVRRAKPVAMALAG
jgi:DNA-binding NtrC family response regulator